MSSWFTWAFFFSLFFLFQVYFGCLDILKLSRSPIELRHPDMTIAVDWDAKPHLKQTNKIIYRLCVNLNIQTGKIYLSAMSDDGSEKNDIMEYLIRLNI